MIHYNDGLPDMTEDERYEMAESIDRDRRKVDIAREKASAEYLSTFKPLALAASVILHTKDYTAGVFHTVTQFGIVDVVSGEVLCDEVEHADSYPKILAACAGKTIIIINDGRINALLERATSGKPQNKTLNLLLLSHVASQDPACDVSIGKRAFELYAGTVTGTEGSVIETCQAIRDVVLKLGPTVVQHSS